MNVKLKVTGMTCGHCESAVQKALARVPGVSKVVRVDRRSGAAEVEGTPDPQALIGAVEGEGYSAEVAS
jgi:copper chaperone